MKKLTKEQFEIQLLSQNYLESKRRLKEFDEKLVYYNSDKVRSYRRIVTHIEDIAMLLPEKQRIIIENEVLLGKTGAWYLEYFSAPSYYRHRDKAYKNFLKSLE